MALLFGRTRCPARRAVCEVLYTCRPFLVLLNFFTWLHQLDPPASMEDIVNHDHVGQQTGIKRPVTLQGLKACGKLEVGQVGMQYWGPMAKLVVNQEIRAPWLAKRQGVFGLIVNISVDRSFSFGSRDITEGMPHYSLHFAKEDKHVGKCLSCQLRVKGHGQGLGLPGVKEAILEGLLIGQSLDVIPGHVGPEVVDTPRGPPHVPCPKGKELEAESSEIWCPGKSPPGFLMARQSSLMMLSVRS